MAFEYEGVMNAVKAWILDVLGGYVNSNSVYIDAPKLEELTDFPIIVIQAMDATSSRPSSVVMDYVLGIGFATRGKTAHESGSQLRAMLKDFDVAWSDDSKPLSKSYGQWTMKTQVGRRTTFSPAYDDKYGLVVYSAAKVVVVQERIAAYQF
jgi:hypothetical protein